MTYLLTYDVQGVDMILRTRCLVLSVKSLCVLATTVPMFDLSLTDCPRSPGYQFDVLLSLHCLF